MDKDILVRAGIDYEGGVKRFMGKEALYERVLSKFPGDDTFARIREDYAARDIDKLLLDAHEFKGVCGNMSLTRVFAEADALVKLIRAGGFSNDELEARFIRLETEYTAAIDAVRAATEAAL